MSDTLATTWVRLRDQWIRADRIVAVRLEPSEGAVLGGRWGDNRSQRLMVCSTLPTDEEGSKAAWQEAAVCAKERGEVVAGTLLEAMGPSLNTATAPRYIYPATTPDDGRVSHWQVSTTLPQGPALNGARPSSTLSNLS
ncbi:hypothetical protein ABZ604_31210 [Streptomyces sp. NPDC012473]|uniref:hypothetical protein n=1 Tax=Streptomyces sp. NPDC012473 TaxID=3156676 RepID=UPI0033EAB3A6